MEVDILAAFLSAQQQLNQAHNIPSAWATASQHLNPQSLAAARHYAPSQQVNEAIQLLDKAHLKPQLFDSYLEAIQNAFNLVKCEVLTYLDEFEAAADSQRPNIVASLLHRIGFWIQSWQQPIAAFWATSSSLSAFRRCFLSSLYAALPPRFAPALSTYLRHLLHTSSTSLADSTSSHPLALPTLITLLDHYDPLLFGLVYEEIEKKVKRDCTGEFGEPKLVPLLIWLNGGVLEWLSGIYEKNLEGGTEEAKKLLKPTFTRFEFHVHKTLCLLRSTELFDIIVDYPDSSPALEDIKTCLNKTDQRHAVVDSLRAQMEKRLLHPGADTKLIITQYIRTIRCLRILDPPGVLLSRVAEPIRKYLRAREDTIRCIVSSLIEEGNELVEELAASDAKPVQDAKDEAENFNDPKWVPDPVDAPPDFRKSKGSDIIQLLVSIYDSKDVFIKELQVLLAQRLLAIKDYALEKEISNVEILKIRFGNASLAGCEVMLKDLIDSKRIDTRVHERTQESPLHATIVSRLFWPSFQPAPLKLPGQLGRIQSNYDKTFTRLKPDKKLRWLPQLGTINITVALSDRSLTLDVTPLQASLLELFTKEASWTSDDLAIELRLMDVTAVRNGLYFWSNQGVVKSGADDTWTLLEKEDKSAEQGVAHVLEDAAEAVQSVEAERVEQMRVYWQYIKGMLTNLGALPVGRIHSTLNMLVPTYKGRTTDELVTFLEAMQTEGLVETTAKGWKIVK